MKTIVAIGGGEVGCGETLEIDRLIVSLSGKSNPKLLFIPTASGEPDGYIASIKLIYEARLGCEVDALKILTENTPDSVIREKILSSDIIYVGGGDTLKMIRAWKERSIDTYLVEAYNNGTVLSGLSAGSICWFRYGYSDSITDERGGYSLVEGLGIIPAIHCPHYDERNEFDRQMAGYSLPAIAIESKCALLFNDGLYKVIKSNPAANAFLLKNENGKVYKKPIVNSEYLPLDGLF